MIVLSPMLHGIGDLNFYNGDRGFIRSLAPRFHFSAAYLTEKGKEEKKRRRRRRKEKEKR